MQFEIIIRPLAALEIIEAYDWYEFQRQGLGMDFLDQLDLFFKTLLVNPQAYSYYDEPVRHGKIKRFPYTVVYEVFDNEIVIYSVFMAMQDPNKKRSM